MDLLFLSIGLSFMWEDHLRKNRTVLGSIALFSNTDIAMQQLCYSGQVVNPCVCLNFLVCKFRVISLIGLPCMSHLIHAKWPYLLLLLVTILFGTN